MAQPVPAGFRTVTPHMVIQGCRDALAFYGEAFGAEVLEAVDAPGGALMYAKIRVGDSVIMMNDEYPDHGILGPESGKAPSVQLHLYVDDVDAWFARATAAGCTELAPPADMFWGDRFAKVADPYGHHWGIATHIRDMTDDEVREAALAWFAAMGEQG